MGIRHGGVFCGIADAAMGIAYATTLDEGETLATLELKINFLRTIWQAKLRTRAMSIVTCGAFGSEHRRRGHGRWFCRLAHDRVPATVLGHAVAGLNLLAPARRGPAAREQW